MSKVLRAVAVVAAVVAIVATIAIPFVGAALAATLVTVASVASAVSAVAATGAQLLQKPPDVKGSVNEVVIGANMPVPYVMGRTFVGGMKVYDDSSAGVNGHPNKDRHQVFVGTHAGPIDSYEGFYFDYSPVSFSGASFTTSRVATGYYGADGGYLWLSARLGNRPETALASHPGRSAMRNWGSTSALSGMAAWAITMEFDEDGERYAGGLPAPGMVAKWVKAYDPRLDSTYPGGSGSQRWSDESTWTWTENPGLHALTYARGRYMGPNNIKVIGPGLPKQSIDIPAFVELANICDANGWTCGGAVYEGPGISRWNNLKIILAAGAAAPAWVGGLLTVKASAPKVGLYDITSEHLAEGDIEIQVMKPFKDRHNTIVPRVRSEAHRWEYIQLDAVTEPTYLAEDGELKTDEVQFDLCQDKDQGAQLAAYEIVNRREFGPIKFNLKPEFMGVRPGEAATVNIPEAGLVNQLAVIVSRSVDPATGVVQITLESETTAKHTWALTRAGVAPPTPSIVAPEDVDAAVTDLAISTAQLSTLINASRPSWQPTSAPVVPSINTSGVVTVPNHNRVYDDKTVAVTGATVTPAAGSAGDTVAIYYDQQDRSGGAVTYQSIRATSTGSIADAFNSPTNPYRHFVIALPVPSSGTTSGGGSGRGGYSTPPGSGGPYA